jgi:hypothetical protein
MTKQTTFILCLIFMTGLMINPGCDSKSGLDSGSLEGRISIGPLCPVETVPPDPGCLPTAETYKAYPLAVLTPESKRKVAALNPSLDGSYSVDLYQGKYLVVRENNNNGIGGSNLPKEVTILPGETTILNIDIDTGIR